MSPEQSKHGFFPNWGLLTVIGQLFRSLLGVFCICKMLTGCSERIPKTENDKKQSPQSFNRQKLYKDEPSKCLFPVQEGKRWGFINEKGHKVIETVYRDIGFFNNGLCPARIMGKYGYINTVGQWAISQEFSSARNFCEGIAWVMVGSGWVAIDTGGKKLFSVPYSEVGDYHDGYARVKTAHYNYGFINKQGKIAIDTTHCMVEDFSGGLAVVCREQEDGGSWDYSVINTKQRVVIPYKKFKEIRTFSDGVAYVVVKSGGGTEIGDDGTITDIPGTCGFVDKTGKLLFKFSDDRYLDIRDFHEGADIVSINYPEPDGYINFSGKVAISPRFEEAESFSEGLAPVKNRLWGFIDKNGAQKIPCIYDECAKFTHGLAYAKLKNSEMYIDTMGKIVWKSSITNFGVISDPYLVYLDSVSLNLKARAYVFGFSNSTTGVEHTGAAESDNLPKHINSGINCRKSKFSIYADPEKRTVFGNGYLGGRLYIINATDSSMSFEAQDSRLYCVLEARNPYGAWEEVEYIPQSWCGNSYHKVVLGTNQYWECTIPIYQGEYKTILRYKLTKNGRHKNSSVFYSNQFNGRINLSQFSELKQGHTPQGIMDPYYN